MHYKIDWLAFSLKFDEENAHLDTKIIEKLGYNFNEFERISGRNFYNCGATYYNFLNIFWNDDERENQTMTVIFTGQGCTDLAEKWENDWFSIFKMLKNYEYGHVNFTRIDIALDDFEEVVKLDDIENKLEKGHFLSSKKTYNIVKTKNSDGQIFGETIYIGNARSDNGNKGNYYLRIYDKKAQYISKNNLLPSVAQNAWIRYEIVFSKKYANAIVDKFLENQSVDRIFKTSLRRLLQLLTPRRNEIDKKNWYKAKFWEDFLEINDEIKFDIAERDAMLPQVFEWLRVSVLPTISVLESIGNERGFDIYKLIKDAKKSSSFSKKQNRMYLNSFTINDDELNRLLKRFLRGADDV